MIAVIRQDYKGVKSLDPEGAQGIVPKRVVEKLSEEDARLLGYALAEVIQFVDNPMFHNKHSARGIETTFNESQDDELLHARAGLIPIDLYENLEEVARAFKPLNLSQEAKLFLKLNYARYRMYTLRRTYRNRPIGVKVSREILLWKRRELKVRSQLTQANIPLVLAMAKRAKPVGVDFGELIGEGNMALLRSIDKFDCGRGFKFSTYACRAILKSFSRTVLKATRYRGRFPVQFDPDLEKGNFIESRREDTETHCVDRLRDILGQNEADLSDIERTVVRARFAVDNTFTPEGPMTLERVGKIVGVSKERIRQIQNNALAKLRTVLEESVLSGGQESVSIPIEKRFQSCRK